MLAEPSRIDPLLLVPRFDQAHEAEEPAADHADFRFLVVFRVVMMNFRAAALSFTPLATLRMRAEDYRSGNETSVSNL